MAIREARRLRITAGLFSHQLVIHSTLVCETELVGLWRVDMKCLLWHCYQFCRTTKNACLNFYLLSKLPRTSRSRTRKNACGASLVPMDWRRTLFLLVFGILPFFLKVKLSAWIYFSYNLAEKKLCGSIWKLRKWVSDCAVFINQPARALQEQTTFRTECLLPDG